jgi:hypothetical protein
MPDPQKLAGLNRKTLNVVFKALNQSQINFMDIAFELPDSTPPILKELIREAAENNHAAIEAIRLLMQNQQADAFDAIWAYARRKGYIE